MSWVIWMTDADENKMSFIVASQNHRQSSASYKKPFPLILYFISVNWGLLFIFDITSFFPQGVKSCSFPKEQYVFWELICHKLTIISNSWTIINKCWRIGICEFKKNVKKNWVTLFFHIGHMDVLFFTSSLCHAFTSVCLSSRTHRWALYRVRFTPSLHKVPTKSGWRTHFTFTDFHSGPKSKTADWLLILLYISSMKLELGEASVNNFI